MLRFIDQEEAPRPQAQPAQPAAPAAPDQPAPMPPQAQLTSASPLTPLALPAPAAGSLEGLAITPFDTGAMEQDMGEVAGLKPLPTDRMHRQAGRAMFQNPAPMWSPERARQRQQTLQRNQRNAEVTINWDPLEMQFQERQNQWRDNPRSRLVAPSMESFSDSIRPMVNNLRDELRKAGAYARAPGETHKLDFDVSDLVDDRNRAAIKDQLFRLLDARQPVKWAPVQMQQLPAAMAVDLRGLSNDLLYEYNANLQKRYNQYKGGSHLQGAPRVGGEMRNPAIFDQKWTPIVARLQESLAANGYFAVGKGGLQSVKKYDISAYIDEDRRGVIKRQLFNLLDAKKLSRSATRNDLPMLMNTGMRRLGNDLLYEYNALRRQNTLDMLQLRKDTIKPI